MKKHFKSYKHQGLPGGANEVKSFTEGFIVSSEGQYKYPGMNTMIPNANGRITMNKVGYPVLGIDDLGNSIMMQPGGEYQFPGNDVYEIPMAQDGLFLRAGKFRPQTSTIGSTLGFKKVFPKRETTWSLTGDVGYGKNLETDKEGLAATINAENFGKFFGGQRRFNAITNLEAFVEPGNYGAQVYAGPNFHWGTHPKRNLPRGTGRVDFQPFNMRVGYQSTPLAADSGDALFEGTGGRMNYGLGTKLKGEYALPKKGALRGSKLNPVLFGDVGVDFDFLKSNYDEEGVARGSIYGTPEGFTINPSFAANVGIRVPIDRINLGRRRKPSLVEDDVYYNPGIRVSDPEAVEAYEEPDEYKDGGTPKVKQRRGARENYGYQTWTPSGLKFPMSESSHLMRTEYIPGRGWVSFPTLFQDSKPYADDQQNWIDMSWEEDWTKVYEEAERRGEVYDFGEDKEAALAFGEGSWKDQLPQQEQGGTVSWNFKGKTYSGTLIPGMEDENNRYARTHNGKIKTLPKRQDGGGTYTVKSGDTFNAIAYANGISPEQLAALNPGINIDAISIGQVLVLPEMEEVVETPSAIDNMYLKQAFAESSFRPKVIRGEIDSPVGALGLVQLMPETIKEMKKLNLVSKDFNPLDPKQAVEGQKAYMNWISERPYLNKGEDFVKQAKFLGAYNTGVGNIKSGLTKAKSAGVDIYNTLDWVDTKYLPEETVDYINRITGQDEQFNTDFNKAVSDTTNKYILDLYTTGGSVLTNWNLEQQNKWKGLTETDDEGASIIKGYNDAMGTTYNPSDAWSAITISNAAMAHMGANTGDEARSLGFRPSKSHSGFVRDAFKATSDPTYEFNRYYAQPLNKSGYKIGDILVKGREETKNWKYDDFANAKAGYRSHSDIVVDRGEDEKGEYVILAGGNISNTYKNEKIYTSNLGKKGYKVQLSDQEEGIKMPEESDEADVKEVVKVVEKKPEPTFRDFLNEDDYKTVEQQQEVQQPQPVTIKPVGDPFAIFSAAQASNMPLMQDVQQRMTASQSFAEDGGFILDLDETEAQAYAQMGYIVEEIN